MQMMWSKLSSFTRNSMQRSVHLHVVINGKLWTPKDCAYIQIDGMDQKKTALPHFSKQPKYVDAVTNAEELKTRIFCHRRPIYSRPRRPPPGSATADRVAHIGELTDIQEKSFLAVLAEDEILLDLSGAEDKHKE
ncbi:hypothetical protein R1sor_000042 [Riccia sorocarpa]|uniref:Uncharacterized protein n=1 Tax=Riccia sorocarpa TaxID=122646 RepID=A0ABD3GRZ0_9MARC